MDAVGTGMEGRRGNYFFFNYDQNDVVLVIIIFF